MRWGVCLVGLVACRPPELPPVPSPVSAPVDLVPAQARRAMLVAELDLQHGDVAKAIASARVAERFDRTAAAPLMLMARACAADGAWDEALAFATGAVDREPGALAPRLVRLTVDREGVFRVADLAVVAATNDPLDTRTLGVVGATADDGTDLLARATRAARERVVVGSLNDISALLPVVARGDGALALVVGAMRLEHAHRATPADRAWAVAGLSASGCGDADWSPLPPEWRAAGSEDDLPAVVGYQRAPDDDRGWQVACAGDPVAASRQLSSVWSASPGHPTVREQLWLVQRTVTNR